MKGKYLIIPVEIIVRELESRLLLALFAVKSGYKIILGSTTQIRHYTYDLPTGIIFEKCISIYKITRLKRLVNLGNKITVIDEEGLGIDNSTEHHLIERVPQETMSIVTKYFTWGSYEKEFLKKKHPEFKNVIKNTGNVRVDLWKNRYNKYFNDDVKKINTEYGDYVLFCSSFSFEHIMGDEYGEHLDAMFNDYGIMDDNLKEVKKKRFEEFIAFKELVLNLPTLMPKIKFILRPHPSENIQYWKSILKNIPNIKAVYKDSIPPWILGSKAVVHSSCTSGIEAYLMGKPVISYLPKTDESRINILGNQVSNKCYNISMVKDLLNRWMAEKKENFSNSNDNSEILPNYFGNYDGLPAYINILKEIDNININESKLDIGTFSKIKNKIKLYRKVRSMSKENKLYMKQKFPGLDQESLNDRIKRLGKAYDDLNDISFKTKKIDKDLFLIYV